VPRKRAAALRFESRPLLQEERKKKGAASV
jgi:hypothetical protein